MPSQLDTKHTTRRKSRMIAAVALLSSPTARAFTIPARRSIAKTNSASLAFISSTKRDNKRFHVNTKINASHYSSTRQFMSTASAESSASTTADPIETALGVDTNYDIQNKEKGIIGKYEPQLFESDIYKWWEDAGCFKPDSKQSEEEAKANGKEPYVLPMPPPNVTGRLHMGHAIFVALQDVLARFHRMRGRPVLWLPGEFLLLLYYSNYGMNTCILYTIYRPYSYEWYNYFIFCSFIYFLTFSYIITI